MNTPSDKPSRRGCRRAFLWTLFISLTLGGLLVVGLFTASRLLEAQSWPELRTDVRLEPARPFMKEEDVGPDNAYYYIRQLTNFQGSAYRDALREYRTENTPGAQDPVLDSWTDANPEVIEWLRAVKDANFSQVPTMDHIGFTIPYLSPALLLSRLLSYRGERAAVEGDWPKAWDWFQIGLETGDKISHGGGIINHLVMYAMRDQILASLRRTALHAPPPKADLCREMIHYLLALPDSAEPFAESLRYERMYPLLLLDIVYKDSSALLNLASGDFDVEPKNRISPVRWFQRCWLTLSGSTPNQTRAHIDAVYSQLLAAVDAGETEEFEQEMFDHYLSRERLGISFYLSDPAGRLLFALTMPTITKGHYRALYSYMSAEGTAAVIAMLLYLPDHHYQYPDSLEALVPEYLPRLPMDVFNPGHPLVYRKDADQFKLYSVGPDGIDNGGKINYFGNISESDETDLLIYPNQ